MASFQNSPIQPDTILVPDTGNGLNNLVPTESVDEDLLFSPIIPLVTNSYPRASSYTGAESVAQLVNMSCDSTSSRINPDNKVKRLLNPSIQPDVQSGTVAVATVPSLTDGTANMALPSQTNGDKGKSHAQCALEDRMVVLKRLLSSLNSENFPLGYRIVLDYAKKEIDAWTNGGPGAVMEFDAQLSLLDALEDSVTREESWGFYDREGEQSLEGYLSLLRKASISDAFSGDEREIMLAAIGDYQGILNVPKDTSRKGGYRDQLHALHSAFDTYVARHSVEMAIQLIKNAQIHESTQADPQMSYAHSSLTRSGAVEHTERGISAILRFEKFGEDKELEEAIAQFNEAVNLTPLDTTDRPATLNNLGNAHLRRFERLGEIKDIDIAIESLEGAVDSTPINSADRPGRLNNLGSTFLRRFDRLAEIKDIDAAISHQSEALDLSPQQSALRSEWLNNLGLSFLSRFGRFGEVKDIDTAIAHQNAALSLTLLDSASRPAVLGNLGNSLRSRFERLGEVADIDAAIERHTEAVNLTPPNSAERPGWLGSLGNTYMCRFNRFGEIKDIDLAIGRQLEAVDLTPFDSASRPARLSNLGNSFLRRFVRLRDVEDVNSAIRQQSEALDLTPLDSAARPATLNNLGNSFLNRFELLEDVKDIDAAILRQREAVDVTPPDSAHLPIMLNGLGTSFLRRFEMFGEITDIDEAIKRQNEALDLTSLDSPERPVWLNNLGVSFRSRFMFTEDVKDIDAAIKSQIETVELTPPDSAERPGQLKNLGTSFLRRFERFKDVGDRDKAANAFLSSSMSNNGNPIHRMEAALQYAHLEHLHANLPSASKGYIRAVHLLPEVAWIGLDAVSQLKQLTSEFQSFGSNAAACMFAMAQSNPDHEQQHLGLAVELLDQTRSVLWSQSSTLRQNLEDLRIVDPHLAEELDRVGHALGQTSFRDPSGGFSEVESQGYRRSAERWKEVVASAREIPGFHHFLLPLPISKLREAAKEGPVVIINVSIYRSDAIIIPSIGDLELLPLSSETAKRIMTLSKQQQNILPSRALRKSDRVTDVGGAKHDPLLEILHDTWTLLGEPITRRLKECGFLAPKKLSQSRVWWCLTGQLAFLPIHACHPPATEADVKPIGLIDIIISSYTPTISMLVRALQPRTVRPFRMLAIGQPESYGLPPLSCVTEEIQCIQDLLPHDTTILKSSEATVTTVSVALQECTWVHFACHGVQNHEKPLESGLAMYNGQLLTLSRIAQSSLQGGEFAFLSSCESATGSKLMPNESVHLAAGLQFLGFRGVIGTMWSVDDSDALYVAKSVYQQLFKNGSSQATASDAAFALHNAVRHLRDDRNVAPARWVPFIHFGF